MATKEEKLILAKTNLMTALGDSSSAYLANLKLWFRQKRTKEEFDIESRKLLGLDHMHLHNKFFIAILNKVDTLSTPVTLTPTLSTISTGTSGNEAGASTSASRGIKKRKRSSRTPAIDRAVFEPAELYDYLPEESPEVTRPPSTSGETTPPISPQRFAEQELFLPDIGLVMGRLLVGAWETGLVNAEETAAELVVVAVQVIFRIHIKVQLIQFFCLSASFEKHNLSYFAEQKALPNNSSWIILL